MRLRDLTDYWQLRRLTENPWEVVRFRKNRDPEAELTVRLRQGPPVFVRGGRADYHMFHRIFLRDEYRLAGAGEAGPERWGCVLDLGGNVGMFSSRVARTAERVITYEPVPENFSRLEKNLGGHSHVVRVNRAVSDEAKKLSLFIPRDAKTSGVFSSHRQAGPELLSDDHIDVDAISLEDVFREHGIDHVDLLKIDVEGAEYAILHAGRKLLPQIDRIHGEYHDVDPDDPRTRIDAFQQFLEEEGYQVDVIRHPRKPNHGMFYAQRR